MLVGFVQLSKPQKIYLTCGDGRYFAGSMVIGRKNTTPAASGSPTWAESSLAGTERRRMGGWVSLEPGNFPTHSPVTSEKTQTPARQSATLGENTFRTKNRMYLTNE